MFVAYRSRFHLAEQDIRFVVNGTRVKPFHTPQEVTHVHGCTARQHSQLANLNPT